ncbi:MAG TPA: CpsD/CapB family tyrosine-protein kinase, partial [Desulfitobacteriaceae bacterium]|nr:CpsD/CapB family tyrosine-protein kinase [Desulfitobacteriaceae bacterium]
MKETKLQTKILNVYSSNNQAVRDAYAMLTANIHIGNSHNKLRTFVLTSCNTGEGKTSLAIGLAVSMASSGWKVLLVDADMRKPTAAKRLNDQALFGLTDYLIDNTDLDRVLYETNISNLTYLPSGSDHSNPIGLLCSAEFEEMIALVSRKYDFVLFDTPALASGVDGALIASKVDATLMVVKMGSTSLKNLKRIKVQFDEMQANILGVILNDMKKRDYKGYFESYNYFFNSKRFFKTRKIQG